MKDIRQYFPTQEKFNILIGRFQPLTKAHIECCAEGKKFNGLKTILCMIDRADSKIDQRNPFPTKEVSKLYEKVLLKDYRRHIAGVVLVKNADIVKISEEVDFLIGGWMCGTDRYDSYKKMVDRYRDQINLADDFELIEVKRTGDDISATRARKDLADNNFEDWKEITPFDTEGLFNLFKEYYDEAAK